MTTPLLLSRAKQNGERSEPICAVEGPCVSSFIFLFLILILTCSFALTQTANPAPPRNDVYAPLTKAPKKAAARRNPLERDPDAVEAGGKLFDSHCAECHGELAEGGRKGPSLRANEVQQAPPGALFWLLTNGVVRRGMPVWSKLPEPERWQLVSYIKSLTAAKPAEAEKKNP